MNLHKSSQSNNDSILHTGYSATDIKKLLGVILEAKTR